MKDELRQLTTDALEQRLATLLGWKHLHHSRNGIFLLGKPRYRSRYSTNHPLDQTVPNWVISVDDAMNLVSDFGVPFTLEISPRRVCVKIGSHIRHRRLAPEQTIDDLTARLICETLTLFLSKSRRKWYWHDGEHHAELCRYDR